MRLAGLRGTIVVRKSIEDGQKEYSKIIEDDQKEEDKVEKGPSWPRKMRPPWPCRRPLKIKRRLRRRVGNAGIGVGESNLIPREAAVLLFRPTPSVDYCVDCEGSCLHFK